MNNKFYSGSFMQDTQLDKLGSWFMNLDPTAMLPDNAAQTQLKQFPMFADNSSYVQGLKQPQQMLPQMSPAQFAPSTSSPSWGAMFGQTNPVNAQTPAYGSPAAAPTTMKDLQLALGTTPDGIAGPQTLAAAQRMGQVDTYNQLLSSPTSNAVVSTGSPADPQFQSLMQGIAGHTDGSWTGNPDLATSNGTGFMDMFGLGDMTTKDLWTGAAGAAQLGLGAYGMFKGLDQADTRLNQGQQALDLSREEYDENLRHRQAIVSQNKGA